MRRYCSIFSIMLTLCPLGTNPAAAQQAGGAEVGTGALLAMSCTSCHGFPAAVEGVIPALAGRDARELEQRMQALMAPASEATIMPRILRDYDDDEIAAIAAWFAGATP